MAVSTAKFTLPGSGLPTLTFQTTLSGEHWCKRSYSGYVLGDRIASSGVPLYPGIWRGFTWQLSPLATGNQWMLFEEMIARQTSRYSTQQDGHIIFEDLVNYVPASLSAINSRSVVTGSAVATGYGFDRVYCAYKVFISLPENHAIPAILDDWYSLEFSVEELP